MSKPKPTRQAPQEVDAYLAAQEDGFREALEQLRQIIRRVAPACTERVNYQIPIFRLKRDFVAMSAAKRHTGFHTMSKAIPILMKEELKAAGIWTSGTTLHIKPGGELPVALLEKVLRARLDEAEAS
ncbi:MAG: DUF1801 domain-containing protein [Chloroflexi bacterium]|nr:DUF1801 domain-containing protein [Chloroflexota bacterium]